MSKDNPQSSQNPSGLEATLRSPGNAQTPANGLADAAAPGSASRLPVVDKGSYAIWGELAHGGIGRILRARDLRLDRPVAVKELLDPASSVESRFVAEALVTARLQHPRSCRSTRPGAGPPASPSIR